MRRMYMGLQLQEDFSLQQPFLLVLLGPSHPPWRKFIMCHSTYLNCCCEHVVYVNFSHKLVCFSFTSGDWNDFVSLGIERWASPLQRWLTCPVPNMILYLEDLQSNRSPYLLSKLAKFLGFQLERKLLECVAQHLNVFASAQTDTVVPFQFYSKSHRKLIDQRIDEMNKLVPGIAQRYSH